MPIEWSSDHEDDAWSVFMSSSPVNDGQFLEELPPSPYDGIDPESDLGLTIPGA